MDKHENLFPSKWAEGRAAIYVVLSLLLIAAIAVELVLMVRASGLVVEGVATGCMVFLLCWNVMRVMLIYHDDSQRFMLSVTARELATLLSNAQTQSLDRGLKAGKSLLETLARDLEEGGDE